jgi:hypothetical protein
MKCDVEPQSDGLLDAIWLWLFGLSWDVEDDDG